MTKIDPANDRLVIKDESEGDYGSITPYEIINSVLVGAAGSSLTLTKDPGSGKIILSFTAGDYLQSATKVLGGAGIGGGGDLSANRTFVLDLATVTPDFAVNQTTDQLAYLDSSTNETRRAPISAFQRAIGTLTAGAGLAGGGDMSSNRTIALNIDTLANGATVDPVNDYVAIYDASAAKTFKVPVSAVRAAVGTLTAGVGLTGGGAMTSNRTVDLDVGTLPASAVVAPATDTVPMYDDSAGATVGVTVADLTAAKVSKAGDTMTGTLNGPEFNATGMLRAADATNIGFHATPASLPAPATAGYGAIAYATGLAGGGGNEGIVYCDGVNWRKLSNDNTV